MTPGRRTGRHRNCPEQKQVKGETGQGPLSPLLQGRCSIRIMKNDHTDKEKAAAGTPRKRADIRTYILLGIAAAMCIYGAAAGEPDTVFTKAVRICMECIGLG